MSKKKRETNHFGQYLRQRRKELGLSQQQLASPLKVTLTYISDVELGKRAPFTVERILSLSQISTFTAVDISGLVMRAFVDNKEIRFPYLAPYSERRTPDSLLAFSALIAMRVTHCPAALEKVPGRAIAQVLRDFMG